MLIKLPTMDQSLWKHLLVLTTVHLFPLCKREH